MRGRKMLDLCCGGGLASAGYWLSGCFTEIVGIDLSDMSPYYPFDFIQGDAFAPDYEFLSQFDFIHSSPPCQAYSTLTPEYARDRHERLIPTAHALSYASGLPYVIENVAGAAKDIRPNLYLTGLDVGLPMKRKRLFHVYEPQRCHLDKHEFQAGYLSEFQARVLSEKNTWNSLNEPQRCHSEMSPDRMINVHRGGEHTSKADLVRAFGLEDIAPNHLRKLTVETIEQGIPPRMTMLIARSMFNRCLIG